ncbi:HAD-IA family hydrolase [Streptococcus didelphis]|uniref:HAD-IA family hydrolase n=1 Tax=Streptococcus didelphis TaxID=102886 RepID=UPI000377BD65|nr:HAD-IA family hydrolase [Streptococcus didelphis]WMB30005.1 HAD-IA family hydrolase [Streptococcus didelphis]
MSDKSLIWDFDGTLVESYQAIEEVLQILYQKYELAFNKDKVMTFVIRKSVGELLKDLARDYDLSVEELLTFFNHQQEARDDMIELMPYAKEVLHKTKNNGIQHFIVTHKGKTTRDVLKRLGIDAYFTEVITSARGFARKPNPESLLYLIAKYKLSKEQTFYVGDRQLDFEAARNAGITSINLRVDRVKDNYKIESLLDILPLLTKLE